MSAPRASAGLLRQHIRTTTTSRTAAGRGETSPLRRHSLNLVQQQQRRCKTGDSDHLGGPGGQEPPPQKPSGADTFKRNWIPLSGGALLVVAMLAYASGDSPSKKQQEKLNSAKARVEQAATSAGVEELKPPSADEIARKVNGDSPEALKEMSGRKNNIAGFRAE